MEAVTNNSPETYRAWVDGREEVLKSEQGIRSVLKNLTTSYPAAYICVATHDDQERVSYDGGQYYL